MPIEKQIYLAPPPTLVPACRCCVKTPPVHLTLLLACGMTLYTVNKTTSQL